MKMISYLAVLSMFLFLYFIQSFYYPILGNDNALYIGQSIALREYKNLEWEKKTFVMVDGSEYRYNSSIRPGIPFFVSIFIMSGVDYRKMFQFISTYYYVLLFGIFMLFVYKVSIELKKNIGRSFFWASSFFLFSWVLTRAFIFNAKEIVVYFFALLSLYLIYVLIKMKERNIFFELLTGIAIGVGVFVNLHGVIIGGIVIMLLFVLSKLNIKERIKQCVSIFLYHFIFSAFDFARIFRFIFIITIKGLIAKGSIFLNKIFSAFDFKNRSNIFSDNTNNIPRNEIKEADHAVRAVIVNNSGGNINSGILRGTTGKHLALYGMKNLFDIYIKGKFQIFTNIGVFGFYFWVFLTILMLKIRELLRSDITKILVFFILIYFLFILDVFNINTHPAAIVLWGSTKYAALLLLISMIVSSVYIEQFFEFFIGFIKKNVRKVIIFSFLVVSLIISLNKLFISLGVSLLSLTISFSKDEYFYREKVEYFYYILVFFIIIFLVAIFLSKYREKLSYNILVSSSLMFFVLMPFFITTVGKVDLLKTFHYLNSSLQNKLEKSYLKDIYDVYFFAKDNLKKNSIIRTGFYDIYTYNDYFSLRMKSDNEVQYEISAECGISSAHIIYNSKEVYLCEK